MNIDQKAYTTQDGNTVIVLKPTGRLDITTAWQFRLKLQECISKLSRHVLVNLGYVNFIDSSGLTSLVAGMRDADKVKGSFFICNVHPEAKLVFEVTMMDTVFEIFETEEEALTSIFPNLAKNKHNNCDQEHKNTQETKDSSDLSS
ncbi:MAG: anti-sigma factor antagonist [Nostocales cyanobacterium]|nr:MAG: anti-sigma factor antagonist [Nostocales cyanobacterium]